MAAQSVSSDDNQVFRVPLLDPAAQRSSTGGYPWSIEGDSATVVYLKNVTEYPQNFTLQFDYAGGVYGLGLKTVEGGQTLAVDIRALRDSQTPDAKGSVMPREAARGQVLWSAKGQEKLVLIGRAEQADTAHAMSSSYACQNCCPDSFLYGFVTPGEISGFPGDQTLCAAMQQNETCYGTPLEPFSVFADWWSSNSSVATIDGGGLATAVNVGSARLQGQWVAERWLMALGEFGQPVSCEVSPLGFIEEALCDVVQLRVRLLNSPVPDGESGDTSGAVIAGQQFQMLAEAVTIDGQVAIDVNSSVHVTTNRPLDSSEGGFSPSFNLSNGSYQQAVLLNRVAGTDRGTTFRFSPSGGGNLDFFIYTYFQVVASREGLVGGTTACGHTIAINDHFVALPSTGLCNTSVFLRNGNRTETTTVRDVGPWYPHSAATTGNPCVGGNDPYWNTGGIPRVLGQSCDANNAAIDLGDGTFASLGLSGTGTILWRFD